jgi:hypothetical protein
MVLSSKNIEYVPVSSIIELFNKIMPVTLTGHQPSIQLMHQLSKSTLTSLYFKITSSQHWHRIWYRPAK